MRRLHLPKQLEKFVDVFGRHSDAGVSDRENNPFPLTVVILALVQLVVFLVTKFDMNKNIPSGRVFDCVSYNIHKDLL